jgi:hypothetical protein
LNDGETGDPFDPNLSSPMTFIKHKFFKT